MLGNEGGWDCGADGASGALTRAPSSPSEPEPRRRAGRPAEWKVRPTCWFHPEKYGFHMFSPRKMEISPSKMVIEWDVSLIDDSQVDFYKDKKNE